MSAQVSLRNKINGLIAPDLLRVMLLEMANIASPSGQERDLLQFLRARFAGIGLDSEVLDNGGAIRVTLRGEGSGPTLALNASLTSDVEVDASGAPKKSGLFDGEWIYGSGVSNMKCAFAVYFGAMKAIRQADLRLLGDLVMNASADSSTSGPEIDAAVVAEPTGLAIRRGSNTAADHPLSKAFVEAHRAVFFGRDPVADSDGGGRLAPTDRKVAALAYGPGGVDREGRRVARDRDLGEVVSVPNLVMCTKVFALAASDICSLDRSQWPTS